MVCTERRNCCNGIGSQMVIVLRIIPPTVCGASFRFVVCCWLSDEFSRLVYTVYQYLAQYSYLILTSRPRKQLGKKRSV